MKAGIFAIFIILSLLTGCSKKEDAANQKPGVNIIPISDGLSIKLTGSASDADGSITSLTISWGDNSSVQQIYGAYTSISANHLYANPANVTILVTAFDNTGDSTVQSIPIAVDFKETSLAGIKQSMFKVSDDEFLILTLNMHTYQEARQNEKFEIISDLIGKMDVDFVALQECAQNKSSAIAYANIRVDNMALILKNRLQENYSSPYNFVWDWAHYGWDVWEEGVSILSKYTMVNNDQRYISTSTSTASITSRKVIYAAYTTPKGYINIFSAHTHWRTSVSDEEQNHQISNIKLMVGEEEFVLPGSSSFICGDFNGNPTSDYPWSEGYNSMMRDGDYSDSFLEIYPDANVKPAQSIYNTIGGDFPGRIDYIFMKNNPHFSVVDSQIIFTGDVVGNVSDHYGVLSKVKYTR
jgi:maltose 6'-phosphate phosphatase